MDNSILSRIANVTKLFSESYSILATHPLNNEDVMKKRNLVLEKLLGKMDNILDLI